MMQWRRTLLLLLMLAIPAGAPASTRIDEIRQRGRLVCGVGLPAPGFHMLSSSDPPMGLEPDFCRAVAAGLLGAAARVEFTRVDTLQAFVGTPEVDFVVQRLSRSLAREERFAVRFGPTIFYDGLTVLVEGNRTAALDRLPVCVRTGTGATEDLMEHFKTRRLRLNAVLLDPAADAVRALLEARCRAVAGDIPELLEVRARMKDHGRPMVLLPDRLSREPLAPVVRAGDESLRQVLEWVLAVLLEAESRGIKGSDARGDHDCSAALQRLRIARSSGRSLGLVDAWPCAVLGAVGNYAEIYERSFGVGRAAALDRGFNRLWKDGGLMYPPRLH